MKIMCTIFRPQKMIYKDSFFFLFTKTNFFLFLRVSFSFKRTQHNCSTLDVIHCLGSIWYWSSDSKQLWDQNVNSSHCRAVRRMTLMFMLNKLKWKSVSSDKLWNVRRVQQIWHILQQTQKQKHLTRGVLDLKCEFCLALRLLFGHLNI